MSNVPPELFIAVATGLLIIVVILFGPELKEWIDSLPDKLKKKEFGDDE